jgi:gentisate 1,2-dioxygenase
MPKMEGFDAGAVGDVVQARRCIVDVFCVPSWAFHEHVNTGDRPAILFSHTDVPVMRSLDLYREEAHPEGWQ